MASNELRAFKQRMLRERMETLRDCYGDASSVKLTRLSHPLAYRTPRPDDTKMSKLRVRYGKSDEPPIPICCTALPFSTVKAVALFLEGAAMFSLSRTIYDLIAADILGLRPVPFCGTPYHPAPCNPVGSAWDQAVFALIAIPVTGFAKLMFGNHLICNFIVGWAWANALSQAVVEMKLSYPAICEIGSLTTSGDCIAFDAAFAVAFTLTTALALWLVIVMIEPFAARIEINAEVDAEINELDSTRSGHTSAANHGLALDAHAHSRAAYDTPPPRRPEGTSSAILGTSDTPPPRRPEGTSSAVLGTSASPQSAAPPSSPTASAPTRTSRSVQRSSACEEFIMDFIAMVKCVASVVTMVLWYKTLYMAEYLALPRDSGRYLKVEIQVLYTLAITYVATLLSSLVSRRLEQQGVAYSYALVYADAVQEALAFVVGCAWSDVATALFLSLSQAPTLRVLGQNLVVTLSLTLFVSYLIVIAGKRHETSASRKATGMFLLIHGGAFFVGWTWLICIRDLYVHYLRLSSLLVVEAVAHAVAPTYVASLAMSYSTAAKAMAILSGSTFTVVLALVFYAASRCILGAKKARDEQIERQAETGGTELV
jgi:hypothetical protein